MTVNQEVVSYEKPTTKFVQIYLYQRKAMTALLFQKFALDNVDVALVWEKWINRGQRSGLTWSRKVFSVPTHCNSRSCVYVRNQTRAYLLLKMCYTEVETAGKSERSISAHLLLNADRQKPTKEIGCYRQLH